MDIWIHRTPTQNSLVEPITACLLKLIFDADTMWYMHNTYTHVYAHGWV